MAGTVTPNLTLISDCDTLTGWTEVGGGNALNDPTIFDQRQGSYCIQNYSASKGDRGADYDFGVDTNFSNTVIYCWFAFSKCPHNTNPMRIRVTDASGNWGEWNIFTKATLPHLSWIPWAIKTTVAFDAQSATPPTMTTIRNVGWRIGAVIAKTYIYFDAWRYGTGLSIKAGTDASPAVLEDFYTADADSANAYGIIEKYGGVYFCQGQLIIGSTTAGEATYFKDINQVLVFKSIKGNPTGFYEIKGQGNATAETKIFFGTKSGTAGISGLVINAPSAMRWKLTVSDTNITEFGIYGCTLQNADTITGQAYSTLKEFLNTNFTACYEMLPDTGIVKSCNFISAPGRAIRISSTSHNITDCNFIDCASASTGAVNISVDGTVTITFSNLKFTGNDYDVEKSSATGDLTINNTNGADASTYIITGGGTVTIQTALTLTIRKVRSGNEPTDYVRCSIHRKSDMSEIMNMDATVDDEQNTGYYKATMDYTQFGFTVVVRAREKGWLPFETELQLTSSGLDITAVWLEDPNYNPY